MFGVMLVLSPRLTVLDAEAANHAQTIGALVALMAAIFSAMAQVFARKLVATETTGSIVFYFSLMSTTLALFTIPFGWEVPTKEHTLFLITAGLLGGVGQILLTEGIMMTGVALIILAGIIIIERERRLGIKRTGKARSAAPNQA